MVMQKGKEKRALLVTIGVITVAAAIFLVTERVHSEDVGFLKGQLTTNECLQNPDCYLENWDKKPSSLILFSSKRNVLTIKPGDAPVWKYGYAFGKQVVIKGTKVGNTVTVNDIVPLSGSGKISKSCL